MIWCGYDPNYSTGFHSIVALYIRPSHNVVFCYVIKKISLAKCCFVTTQHTNTIIITKYACGNLGPKFTSTGN